MAAAFLLGVGAPGVHGLPHLERASVLGYDYGPLSAHLTDNATRGPETHVGAEFRSELAREASGRRYDGHANFARPGGYRLAPQAADDLATAGARGTTVHGAERIAGANATRGGVLNSTEMAVVRGGGTAYTQATGRSHAVLQQADGRYSVVVDGNRGLITTFKNLSQNSLDRLANNYGRPTL